jgi:hypothetical protein
VQSLDNRTREELFNEHMKDREKKDREARKAEKKRRCAEFRALLEKTTAIKVMVTVNLDLRWGPPNL